MYKIKGFREKGMCNIVSTFLIFMFFWSVVTRGCVFLAVHLTHAKKQQWRTSVINPSETMKNR